MRRLRRTRDRGRHPRAHHAAAAATSTSSRRRRPAARHAQEGRRPPGRRRPTGQPGHQVPDAELVVARRALRRRRAVAPPSRTPPRARSSPSDTDARAPADRSAHGRGRRRRRRRQVRRPQCPRLPAARSADRALPAGHRRGARPSGRALRRALRPRPGALLLPGVADSRALAPPRARPRGRAHDADRSARR